MTPASNIENNDNNRNDDDDPGQQHHKQGDGWVDGVAHKTGNNSPCKTRLSAQVRSN